MNADKSLPRLAATLAVVRDAPAGLEVLLLQRAEKGDHNSGAWVFPGGLVDAGDRLAHAHSVGLDDTAASERLGLADGGLDLYLAALRESFEEAGLLFADGAEAAAPEALVASRVALREGRLALTDLCRQFDLRLRPDQLHYIAHWLTPRGRAKRFDTRFFVAVLPAGQASAHDDVETVQQVWLRPAQALAAENTRRLMTPTRAVLEQLGAFADTAALLAWARSKPPVERVLPRLARGASGPEPVLPGHPAWHEVGHLDPEGQGTAEAVLRPRQAVALAAGVWRVSAHLTLANSYVVDCAADGWVVIDPGVDDDAHHAVLIAAASGPIRWVGNTDPTQAEGAAQLRARTGARDLTTLPGGALRALPAPGGTLFHLPAESLLFSGTHSIGADAPAANWAAPRHGFLQPLNASNEALE